MYFWKDADLCCMCGIYSCIPGYELLSLAHDESSSKRCLALAAVRKLLGLDVLDDFMLPADVNLMAMLWFVGRSLACDII